jgi:hypothetical protein
MVSLEKARLAREVNGMFVSLGGEPLEGLEHLDEGKLRELKGYAQQYLDNFDQLASSNPQLAMRAGSEALESMRAMARIASQRQEGARYAAGQSTGRGGGVGGGGGVNRQGGFGGFLEALAPVAMASVAAQAFDPLGNSFCATPEVLNRVLGGYNSGGYCPECGTDHQSFGEDPQLSVLRATGGGGGFFEDRVFALMIKIVEDFQKKIEERLQKLQEKAEQAEKEGGKKKGKGGFGGFLKGVVGVAAPIVGGIVGGPLGAMAGQAIGSKISGSGGGGGGGAGGAGGQNGQESRNIEFERIKFDMQKLSQMQQALSNILNTMDELAKSAIRHIKAG